MLLSITQTRPPATDLGYLLHKHPDRAQAFELPFGQARVFYPEATRDRCTATLLLEIDPVALSRRKSKYDGRPLEPYVNDRPYAASSFLSVAIAKVFSTAMSGRCKPKPELVEALLPLQVELPVLPCRGGEELLRQLFEPLGYRVSAQAGKLDAQFPEWGASPYLAVALQHDGVRLADLLSHLYVLIPVLDDDKHYWVGDEEIEKLLRHGEGWLKEHPARESITRRYLKRQGRLTRAALAHLREDEEETSDRLDAATQTEATLERPLSLNQQRMTAVVDMLKQRGAKRVADLGCGEGKLLKALLAEPSFEAIAGIDVSPRVLEKARDRLHLFRLPERQRDRLRLWHGSLLYADEQLQDYEAVAVVEVIEHMERDRLSTFERVLFEMHQPQLAIVTTPNREYNVQFESLPAGKLRHRDHRFEWTRAEFEAWARGVGDRYGYRVEFYPIGTEAKDVGAPTQMGVFHL